jgi:hypothetical protein
LLSRSWTGVSSTDRSGVASLELRSLVSGLPFQILQPRNRAGGSDHLDLQGRGIILYPVRRSHISNFPSLIDFLETSLGASVLQLASFFSGYCCEIQFEGSFSKLRIMPIWKANAEPKCRFFAWTLMHKKILMANNLTKRHWPCDPICKTLSNPSRNAHTFVQGLFIHETSLDHTEIMAWSIYPGHS